MNTVNIFSTLKNHPIIRRVMPAVYPLFLIGTLLFIQFLIQQFVPHYIPLSLFLIAVSASAWLQGKRAGYIATILGGWAEVYFFTEPYETLKVSYASDVTRLLVYGVEGYLVSIVCGYLYNRKKNTEALLTQVAAAYLSEHKAKEEWQSAVHALEISDARFRTLISSMTSVTLMTDSLGNLIGPLDSWTAYTGQGSESCQGFNWVKAIHADDQARLRSEWELKKSHKTPVNFNGRIWDAASANYHFFEACGVPILDEDGTVREWVGTITDIHSRKVAEHALLMAKETAEETSKTKSNFLANMSHEIRTPLGAILGFSELLASSHLSDLEREHYFAVIKRSGELLSRLIDDVLDISKVEAGKLELEMIAFSLPALISDVVSLLTVKAKDKGIFLEVRIPHGIPETIYSDPTRLQQILFNILGNAIKFTNRGGVVMEILLEGISASRNHSLIKFIVRDNGPGLDPSQVDKIFHSFSQAETSTTRNFGGTGLGLALARRLARAMNGDVMLTNATPGGGCTFEATIVAEHSAEFCLSLFSIDALVVNHNVLPDRTCGLVLQGLRVLLVDDAPDIRLLIQTYLEQAGAVVKTATNGAEGVNEALHNMFDVVLMDIQMPEMDGFDAIRELRKNDFQSPVVALTAHAMKDEISKCRQSGFSDHVAKPVNRDHLVKCVANMAAKLSQNTFSVLRPNTSLAEVLC